MLEKNPKLLEIIFLVSHKQTEQKKLSKNSDLAWPSKHMGTKQFISPGWWELNLLI